MKNVLMLLVLAPSLVWAADWKLASEGGGSSAFADVSSVLRTGEYRKVWLLWNYDDTQSTEGYPKLHYKSVKAITYYDCGKRLILEGQATLYSENNGRGEAVKTYSPKFDPKNMNEVIPDTVGEETLQFVCSQKIKGK